ncbi:MAG: hypothetical protein WKF34_07085 [Pyrinomonadaceae bacterium]
MAMTRASKLSDQNMKLMLFILVHGEKGHTYYDRWNSQAEVRALAAEYDLDYRLLDAQVRVEVAQDKSKKHVETFKATSGKLRQTMRAPRFRESTARTGNQRPSGSKEGTNDKYRMDRSEGESVARLSQGFAGM